MALMVELKLILPPIKELNIGPLIKGTPYLEEFLLQCLPKSLPKLNINRYDTLPHAPGDWICNGLSKAVS